MIEATIDCEYRCPHCRSRVNRDGEAFVCGECGAGYPIVCGIPDFRVDPDPYIGIEEDRAKARRLVDQFDVLDFEGLVRHYFDITPEVPSDLAARYMVGVLETGPARARSCLSLVRAEVGPRGPTSQVLEIGCGSGPFLPILRERFSRVIATDIALRWLVIARKRLLEEGRGVELVCACAENLPFPDRRFALVIAANVIEHVRDAPTMLTETARVLDENGICALTTPNRISLAPDPHVRVWGVGFLPQRWRDRYVRQVRGIPFDKVNTRSYFELRSLLADRGFQHVQFVLPEITGPDLARLGCLGQALGRLYNGARRWPLVRWFFYLFGPFFQILAYK